MGDLKPPPVLISNYHNTAIFAFDYRRRRATGFVLPKVLWGVLCLPSVIFGKMEEHIKAQNDTLQLLIKTNSIKSAIIVQSFSKNCLLLMLGLYMTLAWDLYRNTGVKTYFSLWLTLDPIHFK